MMEVVNFLTHRSLGKSPTTRLDSCYWRPNFDNLLSRLACREKDSYISTYQGTPVPPITCKFRKDKYRDLLVVGNEYGELMLIDTFGSEGLLKSFTAHGNAVFDVCWLSGKDQLVSVSGDSQANLWDMTSCKLISSFKHHFESVKCVDVCHNNSALFATGAKDNAICIWDTRVTCIQCGKPSINIRNVHSKELPSKRGKAKNPSINGVSAVAFQDDIHLASAGNSDGVVKIWDLRKTYISKPTYVHTPRYQMKYGDAYDTGKIVGCTSLVFDSLYKTLYGCSAEHKIYKFDCHTYSDAVVTYEGYRCKTFFVKIALSADDQYLLSGSSDHKAYLWKTSKPGSPIMEFPGHSSEVTAVTWSSQDTSKLVTCGDDNQILVWKTTNEEYIEDRNEIIAKPSIYLKNNAACCTTESATVNSSTRTTPITRSIRSFFQPVASQPSPSLSDLHSTDSVKKNNTSPVQILSPSKVTNQNITVSPNAQSLSSFSPKQILNSFFSKENMPVSSSSSYSDNHIKRKTNSSDRTPKILKTSKKRKLNSPGVTKCAKTKGAITNYFTSSSD